MKEHLSAGLLLLFVLLGITAAPASASGYTHTKYPIVLVPGLFGYDATGTTEYFYQIPEALSADGAQVYVAEPSALNDETVRGEQVLQYVQQVLALTGAQKVNLIGHSQGGFDIRYVAAVRPDLVASVTSVATPHTGAPSADVLLGLDSTFPGIGNIYTEIMNGVGDLIEVLSGGTDNPQNALAALEAMNSTGAAQFNAEYPQGLPTTSCGDGAASVNGVNYYSWGGNWIITNLFDPSDYDLLLLSAAFIIAPSQNDGIVPRCGSHLGTVIADNYIMNHLDEVNQLHGIHGLTNPIAIYRQHANRLKSAGF